MIEIITMWHNEEILAPLFLLHYWRAGKITILLDDCTDDTASFVFLDPHCEIREISTGALNDVGKANLLSAVANESSAEIRIVVDADEFVYGDLKQVRPGEVYSVPFYEIFRNVKDADLDNDTFPLHQRTYGNLIAGQCFGQNHFIKPIVFGKGIEVDLAPGNHSLQNDLPIVDGVFEGAHWAMADPSIAVTRRLEKKARMSQFNKENGLTSHDWNITEDEILLDCSDHLDDSKVIKTGLKYL